MNSNSRVRYSTAVEIPVTSVVPSPDGGVRKTYDEPSIFELGKSISEVGTIYPIMVQEIGPDRYELIIGSRRLRAAKNLRLPKISAIIIEGIDDRSKLELMLAENMHRQDLTPFEEAWAILRLINEYKLSAKEVAKRIGLSEKTVRERIQLLSLDKEVQELVSERRLNVAQVATLVRLTNPEDQVTFARAAAENQLSPGELSVLVREELTKKTPHATEKPKRAFRIPSATRFRLKIVLFTQWLTEVAPSFNRLLRVERLAIEGALRNLRNEVVRLTGGETKQRRRRKR